MAVPIVSTVMIDLRPATERMTALLCSLENTQLGLPTPCPQASLGDLVDHVGSLTLAFTAAARKELGEAAGPPPTPNVANLPPDWRDRLPADLARLADAWAEPAAWRGATRAGGGEFPAEVAGLIALDELLVHGWDIAVATGQPYDAPADEIEVAIALVSSFDAPRDGNLFGPIVTVADDAPPLARLLGVTGRDPSWRSAAG